MLQWAVFVTLLGCGGRTGLSDRDLLEDAAVLVGEAAPSDVADDVDVPDTCPFARPRLDARCTSDGLSCAWINECGDPEPGVCRAGFWVIDVKRCGECPRFSPTPGATCAVRATCVHTQAQSYWTAACSTACICERGGDRWVCAAPRCTAK